MNTYEGMFLFDSGATHEWERVESEIGRIMERAGAEVVLCRKWDERKLAYEIRGRKRGCYVLTYFRAAGDQIAGIERDARLSEAILRCLVLRADHVGEEQLRGDHRAPPLEGPSDRWSERAAAKPADSSSVAGATEAPPADAEQDLGPGERPPAEPS